MSRKLKKSGIDKLEAIMLADSKHYEQYAMIAKPSDCGTMFCAAGFARIVEVGKDKFVRELSRYLNGTDRRFMSKCINSGYKLLGITNPVNRGDIFDYPSNWPRDLRSKYNILERPVAKVHLYIKMLRTRARIDGSIKNLYE